MMPEVGKPLTLEQYDPFGWLKHRPTHLPTWWSHDTPLPSARSGYPQSLHDLSRQGGVQVCGSKNHGM